MIEATVNGTMEVPIRKADKTFKIDLSKVAPSGLNYLIGYGLKQSLNDAVASAKDKAEAEGKAQMRLDAILAGTVGVRRAVSRRPADPIETEARRLAMERVKAAIRDEGRTIKDIGRNKVAEMAGKVYESDKEKLAALARKNVEAATKATVDLETLLAS